VFTNATFVNNDTNSTMVLSNVPLTLNGVRVSVLVSNITAQSALSTTATINVLADTDHDGLPDVWEQATPGFDFTNPADGARDDDHDGVSNGMEYIAGTDPLDPTSRFRVGLSLTNGRVVQFIAVSNRAYSVQYTDTMRPAATWSKLADVLTMSTNRVESFLDLGPNTNRFYRIVLPMQP
jgi:hypothetical protein